MTPDTSVVWDLGMYCTWVSHSIFPHGNSEEVLVPCLVKISRGDTQLYGHNSGMAYWTITKGTSHAPCRSRSAADGHPPVCTQL